MAGPAVGTAASSPDRGRAPDAATGEVLVPLDERRCGRRPRTLRDAGVEAIAICFLFSYLNPAHEARAAELVREEWPECFVCTSAGVSPQFREFERFTTALLNAFVGPRLKAYVNRLDRELGAAGFAADLHVMCSNGGVATAATVAQSPGADVAVGSGCGRAGRCLVGRAVGTEAPDHL